MRFLLGLVSALGLAVPAMADEPSISPGDVLAVITHEWNEDGGFDRAVLAGRNDEVGLYLYLSTDEPDGRRLAVHAQAIAWQGAMWGTQPFLELTERGSLQLHSLTDSIGRNRWHEVLTIVFRNDRFVIGGYTHTARDTLDPSYEYACDVNLFNGNGFFNGEPFHTEVRAVAVNDWDPDVGQICLEG